MKINITKEQYRELITMSGITNTIFGLLGDALPDTDYKERSKKSDEFESYLLQFAGEFDYEESANDDDGEIVMDEEFCENDIIPILDEFEDFVLQDKLSNILAWRDFDREHTKAEKEKMAEKNGGYFGVALYEYEKKYWDEFEEHGFERLEVKE